MIDANALGAAIIDRGGKMVACVGLALGAGRHAATIGGIRNAMLIGASASLYLAVLSGLAVARIQRQHNLALDQALAASQARSRLLADMSHEIRPAALADRARLAVTVSDTGVGMNAEVVGRLFQPSSRGDSSTTRASAERDWASASPHHSSRRTRSRCAHCPWPHWRRPGAASCWSRTMPSTASWRRRCSRRSAMPAPWPRTVPPARRAAGG
jgi:hypothetical protein